eukprot:CAMPEP_0172728656 /NCGR_PEP_ID=MMETSP1074-20121228/92365_1 /TAXON_ID=2916 /ORGANISM="Ceratium fusus, Strain PA161109" /LENGTH=65 /DNA_ID=CAMNT_0013555925 /DNA_START=117 /DNA_END=310 /DNA_ORIENTATION=+
MTNETVSQRSPGCRFTNSGTECVVQNIAPLYPEALGDDVEIKEDTPDSSECAEALLAVLPRESAR